MTSNREHDDSEIRIFTCFCAERLERLFEKMLARCIVVGCSNTTNLQEVLRFMPYRFMERCCLVPVRLSPRLSRSIDFGDVSETNGPE